MHSKTICIFLVVTCVAYVTAGGGGGGKKGPMGPPIKECRPYFKAVSEIMKENKEDMERCKDMEWGEEKGECFHGVFLKAVEETTEVPSDECHEKVRQVMKMPECQ